MAIGSDEIPQPSESAAIQSPAPLPPSGQPELRYDEAVNVLREMARLSNATGDRAAPARAPDIAPTSIGDVERLREAELRYRALVEKIPAVTFLASLDRENHEFYVSPQIQALLGFSQREWLDDPFLWYSRVHAEDRQRWGAEFAQTCATGVQFNSEYRMVARDGYVVWVHGQCQIVRDEHGHPRFLQGIAFDITERKLAMQALERAQQDLEAQVRQRTAELSQANEALRAEMAERRRAEEEMRRAKDIAEAASKAKDQFLAKLSHELRTPLMPVLGTLHLLEQDPGASRELLQDLSMIRRNIELEARLIDDLLDLTRISQGKIHLRHEPVDAHATIRHALEVCRQGIGEKSLEVSLALVACRHNVVADPIRLQQVFWNLISNAVKFTPDRGRIGIQSSNDDRGDLIVRVIDSGIGIEPDVLPRIFNAFEQGEQTITRRFGGLGLGLTITKALVEMHEGDISAHSEGKDQGATFSLRLTRLVADPVPATPVSPSAAHSPKQRSIRILVVEDDPFSLEVMLRILQQRGHYVQGATNVRSALQLSKREKFDLLISDIGLPDGSGLDVMRELKRSQSLRGIAVSGFGMDEDVRRSKEAGFDQHIVKPVTTEWLDRAIVSLTADG